MDYRNELHISLSGEIVVSEKLLCYKNVFTEASSVFYIISAVSKL